MIVPLVLAPLVGLAAPQDPPSPEDSLLRAAPEGTLMALACDDVPGMLAGLRAGPLGALWDDEALAPLRAQLDAELAEAWEPELYPGGPEGSELLEGVRSVAVFLGPFEGEEPDTGGIVLAVRDELAGDLAEMLAAEAGDSELISVDGLQLQLLRGDDGEWIAAGEWLQGLVFGFGSERERTLEWAHALVAGLEREPGTATPRGTELVARRSSPTALELHLDAGALMRSVTEDEGPQGRQVLELLGLEDLGWVSGSMSSTAAGALDLRVRAEVPPEGLIGEWLALTRPAPIGLGALAPQDSIEVAFLGVDADGLWRGVEAFVEELGVAGVDTGGPTPQELLERRLEEVEALIGIDLRESLFENVTGEFARIVLSSERAYAHAPDAPLALVDTVLTYASGILPQVGAVHVVGLREGSDMEDLIDALIGLAGVDGFIQEERIGPHWVQSVALDDLPIEGASPCWVVLDDALLFSGGLPSLRAVLAQLDDDAPPSWLDDAPRADRARALVEAGACAVAVADSAAIFERRLLQPLREVDAALDEDAYGPWLRQALAGLAAEAGGVDPLAEARAWLGQAIAVGVRLHEHAMRGTWLTTVAYGDGALVYRSWTEPARD